jgi:intracellular sulfur oxidation DsrE/DsrF family protein
MHKLLSLLLIATIAVFHANAQLSATDSLRVARKDSTLKALIHQDSVKVNKDFAEKEKWDKIEARLVYPVLNGGKESGVIPVASPAEVPDPNMEYKLLFELVSNNPDSTLKEINAGLKEIARIINLHVASGIPMKKITPIVVVHAGAVHVMRTNEAFSKKFKMDNPSIPFMDQMRKIGVRFIICGQAMEYFETKKEDLQPDVKVSLTAQTVLSGYKLKGFVHYQIW